MGPRALATASENHAAEAAQGMLPRANAVDAVVAGVFAAAAMAPTVLLGPVQLLLGGAGMGLRAVDGRTLQPGKGAPRPRGFTADEPIPAAARVGVPVLPAALATALATSGTLTLTQALAPAIALAEGARKQLLKRVAQRGPSALVEEAIASELVAAAGRVAGGILTREDLDALRPSIVACRMEEIDDTCRAAFAPWRAEPGGAEASRATRVHVVAAADGRGLLAIACYERPDDGVDVPELGLRAPLTAAPVLRGQTRVRPGEPRPAPAPIAIVEHGGVADLAIGLTNGAEADLDAVLARLKGDAEAVEALRAPAGDASLFGVLRTRVGVSLVRSTRD